MQSDTKLSSFVRSLMQVEPAVGIRGYFDRCSRAVLCMVVLTLVGAQASRADSITYTGITIADGKLGSWSFHNARVYLTLKSDTSKVQTLNPFPHTDVVVAINSYGESGITIVTAEKTVHANFEPGQIVVAADLGTQNNQPYTGGRGIGFGSISSTGDVLAGYPLGIEDGTIDWGDANHPSPALSNLSLDLKHSTAFSGRGWVCVTFPDKTCPKPTEALRTDRGGLFLYQPYQRQQAGNVLTAGIFTAVAGEHSGDEQATSEDSSSIEAFPRSERPADQPIAYTGALVSDVQLGKRHFSHALIYIRYDADAAKVQPYSDGSSAGWVNSTGQARFKIISGAETIEGRFAPGELYAFFDSKNASVGFGSKKGGRGYPVAITDNQDNNGVVENSVMTAVYDFFNPPVSTTAYSPATYTLVNWSGGAPGIGSASFNLTTPAVFSGGVSSCVAYDPVTSFCANLKPPALKTNLGDFLLSEPYTDDPAGNGSEIYSINWGLLWVEVLPHQDD